MLEFVVSAFLIGLLARTCYKGDMTLAQEIEALEARIANLETSRTLSK